MKIALQSINTGIPSGDQMIAIAQRAESVGIESLWTFEHVMLPLEYESRYPYSKDGKIPGLAPESIMIDPLIALAGVAGATKTIRLATGVNILPQTNPLYMAKQAASLDFISGGRFELGVGIGWLREEYAALGVPWAGRGRRFDDYLEAMHKVWSGDVVEHKSEFLDWHGFKSHPTPVQKPLPIVLGGSKGRAFERIARFGSGWYTPGGRPDQVARMQPELDAACQKFGRDPETIEITNVWAPQYQGLDAVKEFEDVGVGRLVVMLGMLGTDPLEAIDRFADEYLSKLS